jgi:hypothetical protein
MEFVMSVCGNELSIRRLKRERKENTKGEKETK